MKLIYSILILFIFTPSVLATLGEYNYAVSDAALGAFCEVATCGYNGICQGITTGTNGIANGGTLTNITYRWKYAANPLTTNITLWIKSKSVSSGPGTTLYTRDFNKAWLTSSLQNISVPFNFVMNASTEYYICAYSNEANNYYVHYTTNNSNPYSGGAFYTSANGGTTWAQLSAGVVDSWFKLDFASAAVQPTLTLFSNMVNTSNINYNFNISYNGTFTNANTDIANCTIYNNNTLYNISNNVNLSLKNVFNISSLSISNDYLFRINCSNYQVNATTLTFKYRIDAIKPYIDSSFVNHSIYTVGDTLSYNVTFNDTNLYAYNITIKDTTGIVIKNVFVQNLSGGLYINISSVVLNLLGNGTLLFEDWDSHTEDAISDYRIMNISNGFNIESNINITSSTAFYLEKNTDRYKVIIPNAQQFIYFNVSAKDIRYFAQSKFKGHLILWHNKKWLDFVSPQYKVNSVICINDFCQIETELRAIGLLNKPAFFESIGDLNYNSQMYYFTVVTASTLSDEILLNISSNLIEIKKSNLEVNTMLWLSIMAAIFLIVGITINLYGLWVISGSFIVMMAITMGRNLGTGSEFYQFVISYGLTFIGLLIIFLGVTIQLISIFKGGKGDNFYKEY